MTSVGIYPEWRNQEQLFFNSQEFEYKYIISTKDLKEATWENGNNRKVDLSQI